MGSDEEEPFAFLRSSEDFKKVQEDFLVTIDLKYATKENFMSENLYGDFKDCYIHSIAFSKFQKAKELLHRIKPGWKFIVYDCLRPLSIQYKLWEKVKDTDKEPYVANPERGSIHNFGFALDLSLLDGKNKPVDMGTEFDDFSFPSQPILEKELLKEGKLTNKQISNRKVLRQVMTQAGFIQLKNEWWHYDALRPDIVRQKYNIVN